MATTPGNLALGDRLARHENRAVALAHRRARIHQAVTIRDEHVGRRRDGGHFQLSGPRPAVQ